MSIDASAVARVLGIDTQFQDFRAGGILFLPQRIAVIGQGNSAAVYDTTKQQVLSAGEAASIYGFGSPIHLSVLQLLPVNGDGVGTLPVTVYPLVDDGSGVVSTGDITPGGAPTIDASYIVRINNIDSEAFIIADGDAIVDITAAMTAAINASLNMPVIAADGATSVDITSKWKGTSANDIFIEIIGSTTAGNTFAFTQPAGGLVNPDVQDALDQIGNVWETMLLNCMDIADTTTLDKYSTFGDGRWGQLVKKPLIVFTGNLATIVANAIAVPDARELDKTNSQLVAPGSVDLPFVVAARQLARIAPLAQNNPAHDYGSQRATGLTPGADGDQWDYLARDTAVKGGSSTVEVKDGVVNISDVVTFYHKTGEEPPAYRFVVDIVKLQNTIFNLDLVFASAEYDGAPLIPDDDPTVNPDAKKPKMAKAAASQVLDNLGLNAILSNVAATKANPAFQFTIDSQNPKRMNAVIPVQLGGNTNIKSIDLRFGFFFGTQQVVA